jgi:putative ABC transport system permease protein
MLWFHGSNVRTMLITLNQKRGHVLKDLRLAVRSLLKRPAFAAVVVFTLALGIGANTAIFSVVDAVLLRPLPYGEPERLVAVWAKDATKNLTNQPVSFLNYVDWKAQGEAFEELSAIRAESLNLTGLGEPERVNGVKVTVNMLKTLGVRPEIGRDFLAEEGQPEKASVALVSYGLWQRRFGADPKLVGQTLMLDAKPHTVVGVLPRWLKYPGLQLPPNGADIWIPFLVSPSQNLRGFANLRLVGRLKPGITLTQAQADVDLIARRLEQQYPQDNTNLGISVIPLQEQLVGNVRLALLILTGAVSLVLLIACANVANLMLARAASRGAETAIRSVLGAGRWRLVRQVLVECGVLSLAGGAVGMLLAYSGLFWVRTLNVAGLPRLEEVGLNLKVLAFTMAASIATGVVCGLLPSLQFSAVRLNDSLKEGRKGAAGGGRNRRWLRGLVVAEIALASVLLVGAGLLLRSFERVIETDPGFKPRNVLTLNVPLPTTNYPDQPRQLAFYEAALPRLSSLPGVESAAGVFRVPLVGLATSTFSIEGKPVALGGKPNCDYRTVSPSYFHTLGIPLRSGREFSERDRPDSPDAIVINEELARRFFPGENAVGRRLQIGNEETRFREIVGVVGDVHITSLAAPVDPAIYVPMAQNTWPQALRISTFALRTSLEPRSLLAAIRKEVQAIDPSLPVTQVQTMDEIVEGSLAQQRFSLTLLMVFAAVAGILAVIGIYGVMSYNVTQQTHELGIRLALGAQREEIVSMVVRDGARLALLGVAIGIVGSLFLTRLMSGLLFGVSATDPLTFAVMALTLIAVCVVAGGIPALRAARVNAITALRAD